MSYDTYYIYVTALISSYEDMIIAALVKAGFQVSPLSEDNNVTIGGDDTVSAVIALRVDTELFGALNVFNKVESILKELKILYYSLVVVESTDCSWGASQIKIPKTIKALPPPLPTGGKPDSSLN